jgi:hypothetical protein
MRLPGQTDLRFHWHFIIALAAALVIVSGCSRGNFVYSAEPISAQVVDADTGVSLEGVNVLVAWELRAGMGHSLVGYINVSEDITDRDGRFHFPGWGPTPNIDSGSAVPAESPVLLFFKSGYRSKAVENERPTGTARPLLNMTSDFDGKKIVLEKFAGSPGEYAKTFFVIRNDIDNLLRNGQCNWRSMPKFLWATHLQHQQFQSHGIEALRSIEDMDDSDKKNRPRCGSLATYVEEHRK